MELYLDFPAVLDPSIGFIFEMTKRFLDVPSNGRVAVPNRLKIKNYAAWIEPMLPMHSLMLEKIIIPFQRAAQSFSRNIGKSPGTPVRKGVDCPPGVIPDGA